MDTPSAPPPPFTFTFFFFPLSVKLVTLQTRKRCELNWLATGNSWYIVPQEMGQSATGDVSSPSPTTANQRCVLVQPRGQPIKIKLTSVRLLLRRKNSRILKSTASLRSFGPKIVFAKSDSHLCSSLHSLFCFSHHH